MAHRGGERDRARRRARARRCSSDVAGSEVEAGRPDVAGLAATGSRTRIASPSRVGVLLDQDRVGAVRHRRAGEDAHRLAGAERAGEALAGARHADDLKRRAGRRLGGAHGVAVHGGGGEGRLRRARRKVVGEHAAGRIGERHGLGRQRLDAGEKPRAAPRRPEAGSSLAPSARQSPERPPVFSSSRMSVMRMPRSAAFAMS